MRPSPLLRHLYLCLLGLLACAAPQVIAEPLSHAAQIQIHASRATSSLLLLRGEGFQASHRHRLEADLAALAGAVQGLGAGHERLRAHHQALVSQLRNGVTYGPDDDNLPWRYPHDLSRALRDLLAAARTLPGAEGQSELAAKVEYLTVQYLARAYLGTFEIAREQPDDYLGQDERLLLPAIDAELAARDTQAALQTRWGYLRSALADMNSKSNTLQSVSGRPFAPIIVDRHARALSRQWLAMF